MGDENVENGSAKRFKAEQDSSTELQVKKLQEELARKEKLLKEKEARIELLERNSAQPRPSGLASSSDQAWTETEHEAFLTALEAHGSEGDVDKAWASIAAAVATRSIEEVKLHAHEYFFKLQNDRAPVSTSLGSASGPSGPARGGSASNDSSDNDGWTPEDVATFEQGLAAFEESLPDRGGRLQQLLPHKTQAEIMKRYQKLLMQITSIESGAIPIYRGNEFYIRWKDKSGVQAGAANEHISPHDTEGTPWSEEEHRLFLVGVDKFGRDDFDAISQHYVITRSADQVATFSYKYFTRIDGARREKIRPPPLNLEFAGEKSPSSISPNNLLSPTSAAAAVSAAVEAAEQNNLAAYNDPGPPPVLAIPSSSGTESSAPFNPSDLLQDPSPSKLSSPTWPASPTSSLALPSLNNLSSPSMLSTFNYPEAPGSAEASAKIESI